MAKHFLQRLSTASTFCHALRFWATEPMWQREVNASLQGPFALKWSLVARLVEKYSLQNPSFKENLYLTLKHSSFRDEAIEKASKELLNWRFNESHPWWLYLAALAIEWFRRNLSLYATEGEVAQFLCCAVSETSGFHDTVFLPYYIREFAQWLFEAHEKTACRIAFFFFFQCEKMYCTCCWCFVPSCNLIQIRSVAFSKALPGFVTKGGFCEGTCRNTLLEWTPCSTVREVYSTLLPFEHGLFAFTICAGVCFNNDQIVCFCPRLQDMALEAFRLQTGEGLTEDDNTLEKVCCFFFQQSEDRVVELLQEAKVHEVGGFWVPLVNLAPLFGAYRRRKNRMLKVYDRTVVDIFSSLTCSESIPQEKPPFYYVQLQMKALKKIFFVTSGNEGYSAMRTGLRITSERFEADVC